MSIWLICIIAVAAMVAGATAYRLSGRRVNRRVRRHGWSELADARDEHRDDDDALAGLPDALDEIDAYWGSAMPTGVAGFDDDEDDDDAAADEAPQQRRRAGVPALRALDALAAREPAANHDVRRAASVGGDEEAGAAAVRSALAGVLARREPEAAPASAAVAAAPDTAARRADRISLAEQTVGKAGCRLGAAYLTHLVESNFLPAGTRGACTAEDLREALRGLKAGQPGRILEHGAVLQRLGEDHVLLFDPLMRRVDHVQNLFHHVSCVVGKRSLHVVITGGDADDAETVAHIGPLVQQFSVPPTRLMVLQEDGSFHSHAEDQAHHVPAHIDPWQVPESFVTEMLGYAQQRFDAGEPEAALRTLGPLAGPLWERIAVGVGFDRLLMAQVLNLLGLANRFVGCMDEAVTCFESSLTLLRAVEQYAPAQIVEVNLGTTLLQSAGNDAEPLRLATRHLQSAVRLDRDDALAWQVLGEIFLARHEVERSASMLGRAEHAYEQARRCDPRLDLEVPLATIARLRELRRSIDQLPAVPSPLRSRSVVGSGALDDDGVEEREPLRARAGASELVRRASQDGL